MKAKKTIIKAEPGKQEIFITRELDRDGMLWEKLSKGGQEGNCGWLTDKYGLSWQIIPNALGELMSDENEEKSERVFQAMLKMGKIDVKKLERAYAGK